MGTTPVYLLVTTSAFFWGANFVLAGFILADQPPLWAAALRFILGAALMLAISGFRREDILGLLRRHAGAYLLLGAVGITAFNLLFFAAMGSTSADNGALIMATNPLLTTLLAALLLGERPTARHLIALPVALAGVAVVIAQGDISRLASLRVNHGDLLMLAANVSWALYNVLGRRTMPQGSSLGNTTLIMVMGAALLLSVALGSGTTLEPIGIKGLGARRTAIFLNLVPVSAMVIGAGFGTPPTIAQIAGGILVLGGVTISMLPKRRLAGD